MLLLLLEFLPGKGDDDRGAWVSLATLAAAAWSVLARARRQALAVRRHVRARRVLGVHDGAAARGSPRSRCWSRGTTSSARTSTRSSTTRCSLSATLGMMLMASSNDLITVFLGARTDVARRSTCWWASGDAPRIQRGRDEVLPARCFRQRFPALRHRAGLRRDRHDEPGPDRRSSSRTRRFSRTRCCSCGSLLLFTGFAFKIAAVPFHMWTPDAYEGAPTSVTGFMSAGAKTAGFAALLRIVLTALATRAGASGPTFWR